MARDLVLVDVKDRVATVTLNDPERRNTISGRAMIESLLDAINEVGHDPAVSVVIFTGAGPSFCAGGDLKEMADPASVYRRSPVEVAEAYIGGIQRIPKAMYELDVPTIAAVNGPAIGAGCDLAMMCDMRIAGVSARFGEVFVNLGLIPGDAGSWFLIRRLGHQRAAELTFSGRIVEAREALDLGMVLEVHPDHDLMTKVRARAATIAAKPPNALRAAKRLLRHAERMDLPDYLNAAAAFQAMMHQTQDHREAVAAFVEKRPAVFRGV